MTPSEAIEKLGEAKGNAEALRMAKEALGKQIPRKRGGIIKNSDIGATCPVCHCPLLMPYLHPRFCSDCGQAIDWDSEIIDKDGNPYTPTTSRGGR